MKFGEKLQKLRKEKGMSQEELAMRLHVSRQAVSKWENDQGYPETEKMLMLGNIFSVTMDYLREVNSRRRSRAIMQAGNVYKVICFRKNEPPCALLSGHYFVFFPDCQFLSFRSRKMS